MAFWNRKKNWEDDYDEYYAQDRRAGYNVKPTGTVLRTITHLGFLAVIGAIFLGAVGTLGGPAMLEKMLTDLAMPIGIVWITLLLMVYFCLVNRQSWPALLGLFCWLILTLAGNSVVSNALISNLEAPYQEFNIEQLEPLDTLVVLGGGTHSRLNGVSQLGSSGDRVATAARIYHAGKVTHLICTGTATFRASKLDLDPRQEATELLIGMGIPPANIVQMKGSNTFEEMANLKRWMAETPTQARVGIVTSAWHLPRVLRLAKTNDLDVTPIPSDFKSELFRPNPNLIVPSSNYIQQTTLALKEHLAGLVGR